MNHASNNELINLKVQSLENDLELLKNKHIYEIERLPGNPKCSTLATRMKENLSHILDAYEELLSNQSDCAEREQFDLLSGMLIRLASEIADLTKKQPDGLMNIFKVGQINRVLRPLKEIMKDEASTQFLDLIMEPDPESKSEKSRNTYSDVAIILSQYREACGEYRAKYYDTTWNIRL